MQVGLNAGSHSPLSCLCSQREAYSAHTASVGDPGAVSSSGAVPIWWVRNQMRTAAWKEGDYYRGNGGGGGDGAAGGGVLESSPSLGVVSDSDSDSDPMYFSPKLRAPAAVEVLDDWAAKVPLPPFSLLLYFAFVVTKCR